MTRDADETLVGPRERGETGPGRRRTLRLRVLPRASFPLDEGWRFRIFRIVLIASVVGLGLWSVRLMSRGAPVRRAIEAEEYRIEDLERLGDELLEIGFEIASDPTSATRVAGLEDWLDRRGEELKTLGIAAERELPAGLTDDRPRARIRRMLAALAEERRARHTYLHALQREGGAAWNGLIFLVVVLFLQALAALVLLDLNVRARRRIAVLFQRATRDELTGVLNRRAIVERAGAELDRARREGRDVALMLVDLDWFKQVNDRLGHRAGDDLLREAALRFERSLRPYDVVGRYGGDEFLLVLPGCDVEAARAICARICEAMRAPVDLGAKSWAGSVSIGAAVALRGGAELNELMDSADAALYQTKERGRDGWTALSHLPNVGGPDPGARRAEQVALSGDPGRDR